MNTNPGETAVIEVGTETFASEVLRSTRPVLVAFVAPWSRPCLLLGATLEEVGAAHPADVKVVSVNADDFPELSLYYGVQFIPTLLLFVDGRVRATIVGTCSREAIVSRLHEVSSRGEKQEATDPSAERERR